MSAQILTIGELAQGTACSIPTIRYYEKIKLLAPALRTASGHRTYRSADLQRLGFIKRCRDFGFSIEQVRDLCGLFDDGTRACSEIRELAQDQLDQVRSKMAELCQLETSLATLVESCDASCRSGVAKNCVILEDISAPTSLPAGSKFSARALTRR